MTTHEINLLIERYLDGETTLAEERELALAVQREDRPAEWAIIAEMLGELPLDEAIYDEIMAQRAPKPAKLLTKLWPWAAAACVAIAFVLSYNIIKEEPQEIAKVELPKPTKPQQEAKPFGSPSIAKAAPQKAQNPKTKRKQAAPTRKAQDPSTQEPPFLKHPLEAQEPQAEPQYEAPITPDDFALHLALLAEVEDRVLKAEHDQQPEERLQRELIDELLANIQQHSNRPELSL